MEAGFNLYRAANVGTRIFGVAAVDGSSQAAHQSGNLASDCKLAARTRLHNTDTFNAADRGRFSPFSTAHVHFGVIHSNALT